MAEVRKAKQLKVSKEIDKLPIKIGGVARKPVVSKGVICPRWLSESGQDMWHSLVADLTTAGVAIQDIDAHAIAMAAYCLAAVAELGESEKEPSLSLSARLGISKLVQKYQSNSQSWLEKIGATPAARGRMGIRPEPVVAADDAWDTL
jgi:hypothetical protein